MGSSDDIGSERALGVLEGRVSALEERVGRHEDATARYMDRLEGKVDSLRQSVDNLVAVSNSRDGTFSAFGKIFSFLQPLIYGAVGGAVAWFTAHFKVSQ